jgi:hypothetical protein
MAVSDAKESNGRPCPAPCDHCAVATPEAELLLCLGCHHVRYCSVACQRGAWLVWCFVGIGGGCFFAKLVKYGSCTTSFPLCTNHKRAGHKKACKEAQKERAGAETDLQHREKKAATLEADCKMGGCGHCGHESLDLLVCLGCHTARYCSAAHQRKAWCVYLLTLKWINSTNKHL